MRNVTFALAGLASWFALVALAPNAVAAEATIDGASIKLPAPAGFCDLSASQAMDRQAIEMMTQFLAKGQGNRLLAIAADCRQLADWRAGKGLLGDYTQYAVPAAATASDALFKSTCDGMRTGGEREFSNIKDDVKSKLEEALKQVKVKNQSYIGFLGDDAAACYVGILQNFKAADGSDKTQVALLAIMAVKGRLLFVNRYAPYVDADTVTTTLAMLKASVAVLQAANRN
jgi:hypothetical protein